MEAAPIDNDQVIVGQDDEAPEEIDLEGTHLDSEYGIPSERKEKEFAAPAVGMEFESYDDAYNYYNCYAKEAGFFVRVKNSWFKRNSREKYGAVLCCSSQGFKRIKDVKRLRKDTRTGCPAMIRMKIVDSKRWRILDVTLEHNHSVSAKMYKKKNSEMKSKLQLSCGAEGQTIRLCRTLVIGADGDRFSNVSTREKSNYSSKPDKLNLKKGEMQAFYNYFCRMQLTNPHFFYLMDLNDEGCIKNLFWVDGRSKTACGYYSDVIFIDNTFLSNKYEIPLVAFVGLNHHGQSVLLGCGLLVGEETASYSWLFKAWLSCTSGRHPQTIISDRCKILQNAIVEVFPQSQHCFGLSHIMRKVPEKLGGLRNYDLITKALVKAVYETLKPFDFEAGWGFLVRHFGVGDNEWLRSLYEDRTMWAPVYLKNTSFAGMATARPGETLPTFFDKYVQKQTPLKEFLDKYELALQRNFKEEALADIESRNLSSELRTRCSFELQLSKVYTRNIFKKFQLEVEEMYSCFSTTQLHVEGANTILLVKERILGEENRREIRDYEVLFNREAAEVRCICSCFSFYGYLCRHALCVLNFNGVEEIPQKYILPRWRRDYRRLNVQDQTSGNVVAAEGDEWFNQFCKSALQVVEEGGLSLEHYKVAIEAFEECLNRVQNVEYKVEK